MPDIIYRYKNKDGRWVYFNEDQIRQYPDAIVYMTLDDGQRQDLGTVNSLGMAYDNYEPDLTAEQRLNKLGIFFNEDTRRWEGGNGRIIFAGRQDVVGNSQDNPDNQLTREQRLARMGFRKNLETGRWEAGVGRIDFSKNTLRNQRQQERAPYWTDENGVTRNVEPVSLTQQGKRQVSTPVSLTQQAKREVPTPVAITDTVVKEPVVSTIPIGQTSDGYVDTLLENVQVPIPATIQTEGEPIFDSTSSVRIGDLPVVEPEVTNVVPSENTIENVEQWLGSNNTITTQSKVAAPLPERLANQAARDFQYKGGASGDLISLQDQYDWETQRFSDASEQIAAQVTNKLAEENGGFDADTYDRVFDATYNSLISGVEDIFGKYLEKNFHATVGPESAWEPRREFVINAINNLGRGALKDDNWEYVPTPEGSYAVPQTKIRNITDQAKFRVTPETQRNLQSRIANTIASIISPSEANATTLADNRGNVVNITTPALKQPVGTPQSEYSAGQQKMISTITDIANKHGISANLMNNIAWNESRFDPTVKNTKTGATGLFQFTPRTWKGMVKNYGTKYGLTSTGASDPTQNAIASALYLAEHKRAFENAGIPVNDTNLYLGNFLGTAGAKKFLNEYYNGDPNKFVASNMVEAAEANPTLFYKDYKKYGTKYPRTYTELLELMGGKLTRTF